MNNLVAPRSAIILAAGVGKRLSQWQLPKVLLQFDAETLLQRHLRMLDEIGIETVSITVGFEELAIRNEVERISPKCEINYVYNPDFRRGSLVSLWLQKAALCNGDPLLIMDGDVLYGHSMLPRLLAPGREATLLVDRNIEPGDEPVKVCFKGDTIVDFRKKPVEPHDWHGESVGFFRFSGELARTLFERLEDYIVRGELDLEYEEAIRDLILDYPKRFGAADVTDLAWTEIDFNEDVEKARSVVLAKLEADHVEQNAP